MEGENEIYFTAFIGKKFSRSKKSASINSETMPARIPKSKFQE